MNLKLSDWASIAEIVSSIAVIVTLVFLVLGVRDNTDVLRASAYADLMDSLNEFQSEQMANPDSLRVWDAFVAEEAAELDGLDRRRLTLTALILFRIYEKAYFSNQSGLIGESEWGRFEYNICANLRRARSADSEEVLLVTLTGEFVEYFTELCSG